jgi:hypothetical protein
MNTLFASDLAYLSRRDFLRWSGAGLLGLFTLPFLNPNQRLERFQQLDRAVQTASLNESITLGRAVDDTVPIYDRPSFSGKLRRMHYRDVILNIDEVVIGDEKPQHNRVWYHVPDQGYAHSGKVQPVQLLLNQPISVLPTHGLLVEVSVPFTDIFHDLEQKERVKYRLYYSTVHWARAIEKDSQAKTWYALWDDKYKEAYYARAEHLRIIPQDEIKPISPGVAPEEKRIEVWRTAQLVIAYQHNEPAMITKTASGGHFIDGDYTTPSGLYVTSRKRPSRHMASDDRAAPNGYDLPGVPWVCYITKNGISFHGTFWHNDFGKPRSHGCLNLPSSAAHWLYRWTQPVVPYTEETITDETGTRVDIL